MNPFAMLRDLILQSFDESELNSLCFDLQIPKGNLQGATIREKIESLILYCHRRRRLQELIEHCKSLRPHLDWTNIKNLELAVPPPDFAQPSSNFWKFIIAGLLIFVMVAAFGIFFLFRAKSANISVRVADESGSSIQGASVLLFYNNGTRQKYTDSFGAANIPITYSGRQVDVRVIVEANQHELFEREIIVPDETTLAARLDPFSPTSSAVLLRIINDKGVPLSNAELVLVTDGNSFSQVTDNNGLVRFELEFITTTLNAFITVNSDGSMVTNQRITLKPNQLQDIRLLPDTLSVIVERNFPEPKTPTDTSTVVAAVATTTATPKTPPSREATNIATAPTPIPITPAPTETPTMSKRVVSCFEIKEMILTYSIIINCELEAGEIDRFEFFGQEDERILVQIAYQEGTHRPCFELVAPSGTRTEVCDIQFSKNIDLTLDQTGNYQILVSAQSSNTTGSYFLGVERIAPIDHSVPTLTFGSTTDGVLEAGAEIDQFQFDAADDDAIILQVTYINGDMRPCMKLLAPDGFLVEEVCNIEFSKTIDTTLTQSGTYLVLIFDNDYKETGDYIVTLKCITGSC